MKGRQLILLFILLAVIGGLGAYLYYNREHKEFPEACLAVPGSAVFVYQGHQLHEEFEGLKKQEMYKFLSRNASVSLFEQDYQYFDSILKGSSSIVKSIATHPMVISLHVTSAENHQLLFLHQTEDEFNAHDLEKIAKDNIIDARVLDHTYEKVKVSEILNGNKQPVFAFAFMDGIVAISRNTGLVEEAVHAYSANKSSGNNFVRNMADGYNDEKFYINYGRLPGFLNVYSSAEIQNSINELADLNSFGSYTWKEEGNILRLNGDVNSLDKKPSLWDRLQNEKPCPCGIISVLPSGTSVFMDWCLDSFGSYHIKYKKYLSDKG